MIYELIDIGWSVKMFPYSPEFSFFQLPSVATLVPKVFNPPFISGSFLLMPFRQLSGRNWPLKPAVDELFVIMTMTNPFKIAHHFYLVIQEIGRCVHRILIHKNEDTRFVEIDFDQIFVLMMLCIFASGFKDILQPMAYACSFAEFVRGDPEKQYGMSHMEGLCAHLPGLNYAELARESARLLEDVDDPLHALSSP
jgi:hypothetical protein